MHQSKRIIDLKGFLFIALILYGFWFMMTPSFDTFNVVTGLLVSLGITNFWRHELFRPGYPLRFCLTQVVKLLWYFIHLFYNIIVANFAVAVIVLSRKMPISPGFIMTKTKLTKELSQVLYANSITLTPGTITIGLNGNRLLVHALTEDAAKSVSDWYLQDMMREIEVRCDD